MIKCSFLTLFNDAEYIKNKEFNDQNYRNLIIENLKKYGKEKKKDIRNLLWDKLPDALYDDKRKNSKISTLLTALRVKGIITTDSPNQQISNWGLVEDADNCSEPR